MAIHIYHGVAMAGSGGLGGAVPELTAAAAIQGERVGVGEVGVPGVSLVRPVSCG